MSLESKGHALCYDTTSVKHNMRNTPSFNFSKEDSQKGAATPCGIMSFEEITFAETMLGVF